VDLRGLRPSRIECIIGRQGGSEAEASLLDSIFANRQTGRQVNDFTSIPGFAVAPRNSISVAEADEKVPDVHKLSARLLQNTKDRIV
jgi:hypothetical protein